MSRNHQRNYDLLLLGLGPGEESDGGVFVRLDELIAMLRHEALVADEGECVEDCLESIADGLARQSVELLDALEALDD